MSPKEQRNELLAAHLVEQLKHRHYDAIYCATSDEAVSVIVDMIPDGSSVTWGG